MLTLKRFIYRALIDLGYQVDYTVLQSGEYGVPQSRQRVIFWGALQGYELPKFPQPSTTFSGRCFDKNSGKTRRCAPLPGITVGESIGDLPAFDWVNSYNVVKSFYEKGMDRLKRAEAIEQLHVTHDQAYVGNDEQHYTTPPTCEFQRNMRVGLGKLTNHVTPSWFDVPSYGVNGGIRCAKTEQVCSVAMNPRVNHTSLPTKLKPSNLLQPGKSVSKTQFGRLDVNSFFDLSGEDGSSCGRWRCKF